MSVKKNDQSFSASDFEKALAEHDYEFNVGQVVNGKVISHESNGIYVDIGGKSPGFLPTEEAALGATTRLIEALPVDSEHKFLIVRGQDADGEVQLSIRRLLVKQVWEELRQLQEESQPLDCRVIGSNKGGVVVDVKGLRGFIPRSHLVDKTNLAGLTGQTLPVVFVDLDESRNKLILSHRLAAKASTMSQLSKGQLVIGKVSNIRPFGAFVDFGGISGLLHVKEVSQKYIGDISAVFKEGDDIKAVVIDVDESRGRISLSTKILENHTGEILENMEQVFAEAEQRLEKNIQQLWNM